MEEYRSIGKIDVNKLGDYANKVITDEVVLTNERLYNHVLILHKDEYAKLEKYIKEIIENPDFIIEDNKNKDTIILMKHIDEINRNGRIVIKLAVANDEKHPKNSIITLMELNDRTWKQTLKNRGNVIFEKI